MSRLIARWLLCLCALASLFATVQAATCFAVDDDSGRIITFNRDAPLTLRYTTTISSFSPLVTTALPERIEAAYFDAVQNRYFVVDQGGNGPGGVTQNTFPNRLGWIDPFSGVITYVGAALGTATLPTVLPAGTGNNTNKIIGLTRNPVSNRWYVLNNNGALFEIDVGTGTFIPGAFGGQDYLQVRTPAGASIAGTTVEDLAFDATGRLYVVSNNPGPNQFLQNVNLITGWAASAADIGIDEVEGLALTNGEMRAIVGAGGTAGQVRDVYRLDLITGAPTLIFKLPNVAATAADYEAKGCNDSFVRADLALTKQVQGTAVGPVGTTFTFVLVLEHQGIDPAYRIQVKEELPVGLAYASHSIASPCPVCSYDPVTSLWSIDTIDIGQRRTLTLVVSSAGAATDTVQINRAQVVQMCEGPTGPCVPLADFDSTPNNKSGNWSPTEDDEAVAQVIVSSTPGIAKVFVPTSGLAGSTSSLVISVVNPNTSTVATFTSFVDVYPPGMTNAAGPAPVTDCAGGTVSASAGGGSLTVSGAPVSVAATSACAITVTVVLGSGVGFYANTIPAGSLTTNIGGNANTITATYQVTPANINVTKDFTPDAISPGRTSTLSIRLSNPTSITGTFTAAFTDNLPSGVVLATASNALTSCSGTGGPTTTTTSIGLPTTRAIPANGLCTLTVVVTGNALGNYTNIIPVGSVQTAVGSNLGTATAPLLIAAPSISKSFTPTSLLAGQSATLTITITNPQGASATLTAVFVDQYPPGMINTTPVAVNGTCPAGAPAATAGGNTVTLSIGTIIPPLGSCQVAVRVTTTGTGTYVNTIAAGSLSTALGSNQTVSQATLTVAPLTNLQVQKAVTPTFSLATGTLQYTVTITNLGPSTATRATLVDAFEGVALVRILGITSTNALSTVTAITTSTAAISATYTLTLNQTITFVFIGTPTIYNGFVTNTARVSPAAGATDPNLTDNVASVQTLLTPTAGLGVTKTNSLTGLTAGQTTTYSITFANAGVSAADGAVISDSSSQGLVCTSLTCTATGGAVCGPITVATFQAGHPLPSFPSGSGVVVALTCGVTATGL